MAETIELTVEPRQVTGKAVRKLRREGILPGVIYGYQQQSGLPFQVDSRTFERAYLRAGNVHLIDVHVGEDGALASALVQNVSRDPVSHALVHVDLLALNLTEEVTTSVPIELVGTAPAVLHDIGVLLHTLEALHVRALPRDIPETIRADVSGMDEVGSTIYVKDLTVPESATLLNDPEEVVARITQVRVVPEEEMEATEAAEAEAEATGMPIPPGVVEAEARHTTER